MQNFFKLFTISFLCFSSTIIGNFSIKHAYATDNIDLSSLYTSPLDTTDLLEANSFTIGSDGFTVNSTGSFTAYGSSELTKDIFSGGMLTLSSTSANSANLIIGTTSNTDSRETTGGVINSNIEVIGNADSSIYTNIKFESGTWTLASDNYIYLDGLYDTSSYTNTATIEIGNNSTLVVDSLHFGTPTENSTGLWINDGSVMFEGDYTGNNNYTSILQVNSDTTFTDASVFGLYEGSPLYLGDLASGSTLMINGTLTLDNLGTLESFGTLSANAIDIKGGLTLNRVSLETEGTIRVENDLVIGTAYGESGSIQADTLEISDGGLVADGATYITSKLDINSSTNSSKIEMGLNSSNEDYAISFGFDIDENVTGTIDVANGIDVYSGSINIMGGDWVMNFDNADASLILHGADTYTPTTDPTASSNTGGKLNILQGTSLDLSNVNLVTSDTGSVSLHGGTLSISESALGTYANNVWDTSSSTIADGSITGLPTSTSGAALSAMTLYAGTVNIVNGSSNFSSFAEYQNYLSGIADKITSALIAFDGQGVDFGSSIDTTLANLASGTNMPNTTVAAGGEFIGVATLAGLTGTTASTLTSSALVLTGNGLTDGLVLSADIDVKDSLLYMGTSDMTNPISVNSNITTSTSVEESTTTSGDDLASTTDDDEIMDTSDDDEITDPVDDTTSSSTEEETASTSVVTMAGSTSTMSGKVDLAGGSFNMLSTQANTLNASINLDNTASAYLISTGTNTINNTVNASGESNFIVLGTENVFNNAVNIENSNFIAIGLTGADEIDSDDVYALFESLQNSTKTLADKENTIIDALEDFELTELNGTNIFNSTFTTSTTEGDDGEAGRAVALLVGTSYLNNGLTMNGSGDIVAIIGEATISSITASSGSTIMVGSSAEIDSEAESDADYSGKLTAYNIDANGATFVFDPPITEVNDTSSASQGALFFVDNIDANLDINLNSIVSLGSADLERSKKYLDGYLSFVNTDATWQDESDSSSISNNLTSALIINTPQIMEADTSSLYIGTDSSAITANSGDIYLSNESLTIVNATNMTNSSALTSTGTSTFTAEQEAKLFIMGGIGGQDLSILNGFSVNLLSDDNATYAWLGNNIDTETALLSANASWNGTSYNITLEQVAAQSVFPTMQNGTASLIDAMVASIGIDTASTDASQRFISRAMSDIYIGQQNASQAVNVIEGATQMAAVAGVAKTAFDTSIAVQNILDSRLGIGQISTNLRTEDSTELWILPFYNNSNVDGMKADSYDNSYTTDLGGIVLGADYKINDMFRVGISGNFGSGSTSSDGDFSTTRNSLDFWGISAYGAIFYDNFSLSGDLGYLSTNNDLSQKLPSAMEMGNLSANVDSRVLTAGIRAEYLFETACLDIIPYAGIRYSDVKTSSYNVSTGSYSSLTPLTSSTVFSIASDSQSIWTMPLGVLFSKSFETEHGYQVRPQLDLGVIANFGDYKANTKVQLTGLTNAYTLETTNVDDFAFKGGLGLEIERNNFTFNLNYNLQKSSHTTDQSVYGTVQYRF